MALTLYGHPFSSFTQKVLVALAENGTPFTLRQLGDESSEATQEWQTLWPIRRFPILIDDGQLVAETSIIIEHLDLRHPGSVRLIPEDRAAALETRLMDRFFDNYVMTPVMRLAFNASRPAEHHDAYGATEERAMLDNAYGWLDGVLATREYAAGANFSLADCAAAPALLYGHWAHAIGREFPNLRRYRSQLLARPSFKRVTDDARPYRKYFPLGTPTDTD
jgi:glutathione S-transferase